MRLIIAPSHVDAHSHGIALTDPQARGTQYLRIEGKEFSDLRLVLLKEVIPARIPARHHDHPPVEHHQLLMAVVGILLIEMNRGDQTQLRPVLGKEIGHEVMMGGLTDLKPRILIGKTHRHRRAPMRPPPGIHMPILQHVVCHAPLIMYENHMLNFLDSTLKNEYKDNQ